MEQVRRNLKKHIALALFILLGLTLFVVAIFVIGSKQNLFTRTFHLSSVFETVSGLRSGSSVRFNGINVGTVEEINIIGLNKVNVEMIIDDDVRRFIKKDSKATVTTEGLVGNRIVEITPGSPELASVEDGETIVSVRPLEAEDIFRTLKHTGENADSISKEIVTLFENMNRGKGTIGQLITNEDLYNRIGQTINNFSQSSLVFNHAVGKLSSNADAISTDVTNLTPRLREITNDIAEISRKINSSENVAGTLLTDTAFARNLKDVIININKTTANLEEGSKSLNENMEALKHNFLFKGYFEDIGYFDRKGKTAEDKERELRQKEAELNEKENKLREMEKKLEQEKENK